MSLERLDLTNFQRGLNLRAGEFQLTDGESPSMRNIEVDPVSGFFVRPGWVRWNVADIGVAADWDPRLAASAPLSTGLSETYVTSDNTVFAASPDGIFSDLAVPCNASPHLADLAFWGDTTYMATGANAALVSGAPTKRIGTNAPTTLADPSLGWNDDYTVPLGGAMPFAEFAETHAGYLFVANIVEQGTDPGLHQNRVRWSHPDQPEDWADNDFIDIDLGGGRITGLKSFRDHLLIFKAESVWALYGYDLDSWQLVELSRSVGAPATTAIGRNEQAVFFFSDAAGTGVFQYDGSGIDELSESLKPAMDEILEPQNVWVGWVDRRLWVSTDWTPPGCVCDGTSGAFVLDPTVGDEPGSWVYHEPALGAVRCIVQGSEAAGEDPLLVLADGLDDDVACMVRIPPHHGKVVSAQDEILSGGTLTSYPCHYLTRWLTADWPERTKSWLRPRFVARRMDLEVSLRLDVYKDYNAETSSRSGEGIVSAGSQVIQWKELGFDDPPFGFDFTEGGADDPSGRGADYTSGAEGSAIGRVAQGWGPARAIALRFSNATNETDAGRPWAIDAAFLKYRYRRHTT